MNIENLKEKNERTFLTQVLIFWNLNWWYFSAILFYKIVLQNLIVLHIFCSIVFVSSQGLEIESKFSVLQCKIFLNAEVCWYKKWLFFHMQSCHGAMMFYIL